MSLTTMVVLVVLVSLLGLQSKPRRGMGLWGFNVFLILAVASVGGRS